MEFLILIYQATSDQIQLFGIFNNFIDMLAIKIICQSLSTPIYSFTNFHLDFYQTYVMETYSFFLFVNCIAVKS